MSEKLPPDGIRSGPAFRFTHSLIHPLIYVHYFVPLLNQFTERLKGKAVFLRHTLKLGGVVRVNGNEQAPGGLRVGQHVPLGFGQVADFVAVAIPVANRAAGKTLLG